MEVYIDKANLKFIIASSSHPLFSDTMRMLKNKFNIKFNFSKEDIDKDNDQDIRLWFTTMVDGVGSNDVLYLSEPFPTRPLKINMHTTSPGFSREQLSSVYLLQDDNVEKIKNKGCFLIASVGEEVDTLSHLIIKDSDYRFDKKLRLADMSSWSDFKDHISPCSDIILIDQYILCDENIYECNMYSLIKTLLQYAKEAKISIVIITRKSHYNKGLKADIIPDWNNIKVSIKSAVESICGVKPNVTFVLTPQNIAEHDRTIFTNYRRLYSGDSFNYFDSMGKIISKGKEVHLCSMADIENYELGLKLLDDVQKLITSTQKLNNDLIIGDKKSNYLNFE